MVSEPSKAKLDPLVSSRTFETCPQKESLKTSAAGLTHAAMGHGSSRSVVLGPPPPFPPKKYAAHPRHRVLPLPVEGGRRGLRTTDNGSALHAVGTIRGGAPRPRTPQRIEFLEGKTTRGEESFTNLRNHSMFHSDPKIARRDDSHGGNRKSCGSGGGASRVKCMKKKSRAPPPPPSVNSLLAYMPVRAEALQTSGRQDLSACKCIVAKTRAPPPPVALLLPEAVTTASSSMQSPVVSRECSRKGRKTKKVRPLEKCHWIDGVNGRIDGEPPPAGSLPEDPFQEEIRAVTREIARHQGSGGQGEEKKSPPKFYFADPGVFLLKESQKEVGREGDALNRRSLSQQEEEHPSKCPYQDIDVRLRPMLTRKMHEVPKFSSSVAWRALGSNGHGSRSSTDDEDSFAGTRIYCSDTHWTPRQDLSDDVGSDSSDDSEAVVPRTRGDISARFSLPTVMFSNMRPIGKEVRARSVLAEVKWDDVGRFRKFVTKGEEVTSDSNWTFGQSGLQKRGRQYSSELLLSSKKKQPVTDHGPFGDFLLGDILVSKSNHLRRQMKSSDSGYSNFSFYSTDGRVMYASDRKRSVAESSPPPTGSRVSDMRQRFDTNLAARSAKKKAVEAGRRRGEELARMLEDQVWRRRNEEKIGIRQQLRSMKQRRRFDEEDEAYFTEPKSRQEEEAVSFEGLRSPRQYAGSPAFVTSRLSHWKSSPALLEYTLMGGQSTAGGLSSPESEIAAVWTPGDHLHQTKRSRSTNSWLESSSSSPPKNRRRKSGGIYQQLMDIVRKEERQMQRAAQRGGVTDSQGSSHRSASSSSSDSGGGGPPSPPAFRVARSSAQPYSPGGGKYYRPVPFGGGCSRLPG